MNETFTRLKDKVLDRYFEVDEVLENVKIEKRTKIEMDHGTNKDNSLQFNQNDLAVVETSQIALETEIQGIVNSVGDLHIKGTIVGDVISQGHIVVEGGEITGNIQAKSVSLMNAKVQGNIVSETFIDITKESQVIGNITGSHMTLESRCKGNIYAEDYLHFKSNANVKGDVRTSRIKIDDGAIIDGQIKMKKK